MSGANNVAIPPNAAQATLQRELVVVFSNLAELFGNPRSLGEIYGVLFASEHPLSMEEIIRRLGISKGSASQGLRQLEDLGAVLREKENGGRSHLYAARLRLAGVSVTELVRSGRHHFDIVDELVDPATDIGAFAIGGDST